MTQIDATPRLQLKGEKRREVLDALTLIVRHGPVLQVDRVRVALSALPIGRWTKDVRQLHALLYERHRGEWWAPPRTLGTTLKWLRSWI